MKTKNHSQTSESDSPALESKYPLELTWVWDNEQTDTYPHLVRVQAEYKGFRASVYTQAGIDYNKTMERKGSPSRKYHVCIEFENCSNQELKKLKVDSLVISMEPVRDSLRECLWFTEKLMTDMVRASLSEGYMKQ